MSTVGNPQRDPTVRGTLQWLLVQFSDTIQDNPNLSRPTVEKLRLWGKAAQDALSRKPPDSPEETRVNISSLLSQRDHRGRVEMTLDETVVQLLPGDALGFAREIIAAAEAARCDQALFEFAVQQIGASEPQAAQLVRDSRLFRAGKEALEWVETTDPGETPQ